MAKASSRIFPLLIRFVSVWATFSNSVGAADVKAHRGGTYICMEGPAFSTMAESNVYRSWGMDIIGMTNFQEAKLAREAEICYATLALVTDYDCWHPGHDAVSIETVIEYLNKNVRNAQIILREALKLLQNSDRDCKCGSALKHAIFTAPDLWPDATTKNSKRSSESTDRSCR